MTAGVARRAARAHGTGWRARRAVRWLVRAGDRGDRDAIDALWDVWLADPVAEVQAALDRWRRPHSGGGLSLVALGEPAAIPDVVDAAGRAGHPIQATARAAVLDGSQELVDAVCAAATADDGLAAFCVEHHLAPADPHRAAVFFLLTGQLEKYRYADPDHSLVGLAYRTAPEEERARIRQRAAEEPDLVRVLAETVRRNRLAGITDPEARYLVDALAGRRDWAGLWELAKGLPVDHAAGAVARFDGWRPGGDDIELFDLLRQADRAALTTSWAAVARPWTARAEVRGRVTCGSMGPDGQRIAVAGTDFVQEFDVRRGDLVRGMPRAGVTGRAVLVLDDGTVVRGGTHEHSGRGYLIRGIRTMSTDQPVTDLARTPKGFVALTSGHAPHVVVYRVPGADRDGFAQLWRRHDVVHRLGSTATAPAWQMTTDPGSGRIALADGARLYLTRKPRAMALMAATPFAPGSVPCVTFCGPNQLAGVDAQRVLRMWRRDRQRLTVVGEWRLGPVNGPACPVYLADAGVLAVIDTDGVRGFDPVSLAETPAPAGLAGLRPTFLTAAGGRLVVGGDGWVTVTDARIRWDVTELAARPLAGTTPADVALVRAQLRRQSADPAARPFLELLHDCLVHRFGTDVALGDGDALSAWADDIALGDDE
ncbi:hypothetical protein [Actinophytocola sp. KF-1]